MGPNSVDLGIGFRDGQQRKCALAIRQPGLKTLVALAVGDDLLPDWTITERHPGAKTSDADIRSNVPLDHRAGWGRQDVEGTPKILTWANSDLPTESVHPFLDALSMSTLNPGMPYPDNLLEAAANEGFTTVNSNAS
ncbi:hypothetical protein WH7805_05061 [Synechococcus sp. WH 7805]|nr:hypothetical protein WH7805_05061 [Synechococcus sp. WH 7805]